MCTPGLLSPSIPKDHSADEAAKQEAIRQANIDKGVGSINQAFAGFNDPYFASYEKDYENNYLPQVQNQYNDARRKLILQLSGTGNLTSSEGARSLGKLASALGDRQAEIRNSAQSAADALRNNVASQRSNLIQMNLDAADPAQASANAANAAASLSAAPTYNPIGDVFGSFLQAVPTGLAAEQAGYRGFGTGLFNAPKSGSSTRVVN